MMAPFDGTGVPQQGQPGAPGMQRGPMPPGAHVQGAPSPVMPHHQGMPGPYGHPQRGMPGQPYHGMPNQSPARQGNFNGMANGQGYPSAHPPLHSSPPGGPPMHPPMQRQMQQRGSMGSQHGGPQLQGMPPHMPQHDPLTRMHSQHSQGGMPPQQRPQYMPPQQQQQQQQNNSQSQSSSSNNNNNVMSGSWQSEKDTPHRREMIQHIVKLLKKDRQGSPESMNKLPQMAKQLEVSLYRDAPSFEAYMNMNTLKQRLQQIAVEVSRKTRNQNNNNQGGDSAQDERRQHFERQQQQQHQQQQQQPPTQQQPYPRRNDGGPGSPPFMPNGNPNNGQRPMPGHAPPPRGPYDQRMPPSQPHGRDPRGNPNDPEVKVRIRHKQQRLLLLHHSAKCPHEDGRCSVTPHCADMKRLWRHMEGCKDNKCTVPHCFSSRAILSHYRKCRDSNCPACGPVRETVRRNRNSGATSRPTASTGPMMNSMRDAMIQQPPPPHAPPPPPPPQQQPQQPPKPPSQEQSSQQQPPPPPSSDMSYTSNSSSSHNRQTMPPPVSQSPQGPRYPQAPPQQPYSSQGNGNFAGAPPQSGPDQPMYDQQQPPPPQKNGDSTRSLTSHRQRPKDSTLRSIDGSSRSDGMNSSRNRNDAEYQKIRHKQQRLLLLRHASRCQHEAGKCPVTPHCASMKRLWEHIAHCKNQQCTVQHCLSSRYVLSHYRRCKDQRCPACGPVRETIRRTSARERHSSGRNSFDNPGGNSVASVRSETVPQPEPPAYEPDPKRVKLEKPPAPAPPPVVVDEIKKPIPVVSKPGEKIGAAKRGNKGSVDHSLLNSFTVKQLETHLASLDRKLQLPPAKLKTKCLETLKGLQTHQHGWVFNCPVDPVELGLPDYFDIIKKPMDLGTVQKELEKGSYHAIEDFANDVNRTFDNAMTYNESGSVVYDMARELKNKFTKDMEKMKAQLEQEDLQRRQNERACTLCGCEKLLFEPPVYFCNGMNCQSQRIRRNSHFYIGGNNQYYWCSTCYNELDGKIPIELVDMTIMKDDLKKKKNDEVHEESWVQCDSCNRWVHQICGLFNTRQNKEHHSEYCCPKCLLEKRKTTTITPDTKPLSAADLPRTTLSEWLEKNITKKVEARKRELAEEKAQSENISLEESLQQTESGGPIIVRQVTAMDRKLEVRELMQKRYAHKNYPTEFPFRCKCIVVFQELDGVDVLLFALYIYEHSEDSPPPNQRVVYISYLDSVHFMRPRRIRTFVYHEILIAYLDYARRRGYSTAHIWACPPLKGDDYIFYAKPEDQKTPRDSRLRQWYIDMLIEGQRRNIVGKVTNMYDLYFANEQLDATAVPYLEGDYFPGEAENIIKMLESGGGKKGGGGGKKKKSKTSSKNKGSTGTRSTGVDEEALIASGILDGPKSLKDLDRDQVMVKLGETIQPMKDSFIVAFLNWSGAKDEDMVVPEEIEKARIEYAAKDDGTLVGSKRDAVGSVRDAGDAKDKDGTPAKIIDDDDEDLDCEFLNNRQAFLNLCRGNHYQFDEVRRSKHTSMMVLWHLHNRDAPKFVQQCVACNREILSGKRFHCNTCSEYDLCQDCYKDPKTNRGNCTHELVPIAVETDTTQERSGLTDAERLQRQRNLLLHIQLIEHASRCNSKQCTSTNCAKMKSYLQHARSCRVKVQGGCKICKRIWTLLRIHAQKCKDAKCPIPQCNAIREKMRQLQKQQQAMDDRRRLEMNRHMRFSSSSNH